MRSKKRSAMICSSSGSSCKNREVLTETLTRGLNTQAVSKWPAIKRCLDVGGVWRAVGHLYGGRMVNHEAQHEALKACNAILIRPILPCLLFTQQRQEKRRRGEAGKLLQGGHTTSREKRG